MITKVIGAGEISSWELIKEIEVDSDVSSVEINGLDGDSDKMYLLMMFHYNSHSTDNASVVIRLNGDAGTNYRIRYLTASGSSVSTSLGTDKTYAGSITADVPPGETGFGYVIIHALSGKRRNTLNFQGCSGAFYINWTDWNNTTDNLTKINLLLYSTGTIGPGSRIYLFRLKS